MKLYYHPASPYARKCRILARELCLSLDEVFSNPVEDEALRKFNPLKKVPILILNDESTLFDSPVICEYLDHVGEGQFFPRDIRKGMAGFWHALRMQALGDGLMDAAITWRNENAHTFEARDWSRIRRCSTAIGAGIDTIETYDLSRVDTIGEVSIACALGYLDLRFPDFNWRDGHPKLTEWYRQLDDVASIVETRP